VLAATSDFFMAGFAGDGVASREALLATARWPRPSRLAQPLALKGKVAEAAESLGLRSVGDLLEYTPRARREGRTVAALSVGETATVVVAVRSITQRPVRRRGMRPIVEATVADETGPMVATFFNQPWLARRYAPGTRLVLHGKYEARNRFRVASHARTDETTRAERMSPTTPRPRDHEYPAARADARGAPAICELYEPLPARLRTRERLPERAAAIEALHFGAGDELEAARRRLAFEELLLLQLALLLRRERRSGEARAVALDAPPALSARWLDGGLPFSLTGEQQAAIAEIALELAGSVPAQRLLMGRSQRQDGRRASRDAARRRIGCTGRADGAHRDARRAALRDDPAPARAGAGHAGTMTGSTPGARRGEILARLGSGELAMIVGTHALIEESVRFRNLALVVIDEQHRFGVRQRAALDAKAPAAWLRMSCT